MPRQPSPVPEPRRDEASDRPARARTPRHWLVKSEASCYSIEDLARDGTTCWDGVRNYQARNFMRDEMRVGDLVLFHHSNGSPSGVAGVARVARNAYTDHTAFDPRHEHHDPRSNPKAPAWVMVDLGHVETFPEIVSLERLKAERGLEDMLLLRRGQRLSVMPVDGAHFERVCALGRATGARAARGDRPTGGASARRKSGKARGVDTLGAGAQPARNDASKRAGRADGTPRRSADATTPRAGRR